jgi:energy-coupling factor transporter ATP-binding protein EcfA2
MWLLGAGERRVRVEVTGRARSTVRGRAAEGTSVAPDVEVIVVENPQPEPAEPARDHPDQPAADQPAADEAAEPVARTRRPLRTRSGKAPAPAPEASPDLIAEPVTSPLLPAPDAAPHGLTEPAGARDPGERGGEPDLRQAVRRLRNVVSGLPLELDVPGVAAARRERDLLLAQFDDYLLPRLARMDAPLLAVVGGSTGAGKSTLTNSLARKVVSRSGVLRPTTRSPVLVHHPHDSGAFLTQRILPNLSRITSEALEPAHPIELDAPRITAVRLVPHEGLAPGLALLDAPDIDSLVEANRELAVQLLGAGDLWIFVTTAARYGDAMPWEMLQTAADRGVSVSVVLDRVPPESLQAVRGHLARMLRDHGLGSSPMFVIPEQPLTGGLLPATVVAPLHRWLMHLAKDSRARDVVVRRTLTGILESLPARTRLLVGAATEQESSAHLLGTELDAVFATARSQLVRRLVDGSVLSGEVLARWQEFIGTGELVRQLERASGRLPDRVVAVLRRPPRPAIEPLREALLSDLAAIVGVGARETVDQAVSRWGQLPGGGALARAGEPGHDLLPRAGAAVHDWHAGLLTAVGRLQPQPGLAGRTLALSPEGVSVLAGLVACTGHAGGAGSIPLPVGDQADRPGAAAPGAPPEAVTAGAALARRVLDTVYGEAAVQILIDTARRDLRVRAEKLLDTEQAVLKAALDAARVRPWMAESLHAAARVVENAR